ncbi:MAG: ArsR/SmtB family transcription factor [Acidimicrobiales bacterium]
MPEPTPETQPDPTGPNPPSSSGRSPVGGRAADPGPVFAALADPTRRALTEALDQRGQATATELAADLPISRQAIAKHLVLLADAGLVSAERHGREQRYRLEPDPLAAAARWLAETGAGWDRRLDRLRRAAEGAEGADE